MIKRALCFLIMALFIIPMAAQSAQISFYTGDVTLSRKGKTGKVTMGQQLQSGDVLKTGKSAIAEISYNDGSKIRVKQNSTVQVGTKSIPNSDNVSLVAGDLTASFSKIMKGGSHKTYTPTTVCAVRGTEYDMSVSDGGDTRIELKEGKVQMKNPLGELSLNEGEDGVANLAEEPKEGGDESLDEWLSEKDQDFESDPEEYGDKYSNYIGNLDDSAKDINEDIQNQGKLIGKETDKEKLSKQAIDLQNLSEKSEESLYLSESTHGALDKIVNQFKGAKADLYDQFLKIKAESNKVMEQQMMNQKALAEVREAYKKAYDKIMGTYHQDFNKIIDDKNFKKVLPDMKEFSE